MRIRPVFCSCPTLSFFLGLGSQEVVLKELEYVGGRGFGFAWNEVNGAGLYLSGGWLRNAGGQMDEDALGIAGPGCDFDAIHEGVDASEEGGGKRAWFFRF